MPIQKLDPKGEQDQIEKVRAIRLQRDANVHSLAMLALSDAAKSGDNVMPHIVHAVKQQATTGEISQTLRKVFGVHSEVLIV